MDVFGATVVNLLNLATYIWPQIFYKFINLPDMYFAQLMVDEEAEMANCSRLIDYEPGLYRASSLNFV